MSRVHAPLFCNVSLLSGVEFVWKQRCSLDMLGAKWRILADLLYGLFPMDGGLLTYIHMRI
jgi:hypothetical protein